MAPSLRRPPDWPYRTWLACLHTGDNHGPPRPDEVKKVLDQAAKQFPGVKVRIGRLSDFGDAILAEKPDLPVVRGDTPDTWIHGPMSDPAGRKAGPQHASADRGHGGAEHPTARLGGGCCLTLRLP